MTFDFFAIKTTSTAERRAEKDKQKEEERAMAEAIEKAGLHKLELNPYWKDGGTPEETASTVGQKATQREQRSLDDVVSERHGSMEEFPLAKAEKAVCGERRGESSRRSDWKRDEEDKRSGSDRERWRRTDRDSSPGRSDRQRNRDRSRSREHDDDGSRARDRGRDGDRERDGNGDRNGDRDREKKVGVRWQSAAGKYWSQHRSFQPLSLESLKGRFLKPSDEDKVEEIKEEVQLLYEEEINKLGAKLVKAELLGNMVMIEKLKSQLDSARKAKASHAARKESGRSERYFQDDDNMGLREKMKTAQDKKALYSQMAAKMMGKTLADMFVSSAAQREGEGKEDERMRNRAVGETRQLDAFMEKCRHCFKSPELPKHLIVALGSKVYLSLPAGVSMADGHCLICPLQHHCCATGLDEDVWAEMQLFRRALVRMFESRGLDCVFMETNMNPRKRCHMVLECIPLPEKLADVAPLFFKKAMMDCDEEWAMNKKVVDISSKDIRRSVPRGLPYFSVDFGMQGGFAHVIENEQKFPHYFGKEVVGGMMNLEPRRWRKFLKEHFDDQRRKVLQFARWWKPYDCTKTDGRGLM